MQKKERIELIITIIGAVILVFILLGSFNRKQNKRPVAGSPDNKTPVALAEVTSNNIYNKLAKQSESINLKVDPFTGAYIASEKKVSSDVILSGILWDNNKPLAIINGEVVKVGQRIGDRVVVDIKKDKVTLNDGNSDFILRIGQ